MTGYWRSPSMMSSLSLSCFALKRMPKNRAHLPRSSPGCSILSSWPWKFCALTFVSLPCSGTQDAGRVPSDRVGKIPPPDPRRVSQRIVHLQRPRPLNVRICSPYSSPQLAVLRIRLLPLSGCSSRGYRHVDLCFCLDFSSPFPPR